MNEINSLNSSEDLQEAFTTYNEQIFAYLFTRVNIRAEAENLAQEVFLRAWKYKDSFDSEKSSLRTWLFKICKNVLYTHFENWDKQNHEELMEYLESDEDLESELNELNTIEFVLNQLSKLSEKDQELIQMRYQEDMSLKDISKKLNLEYSSCKTSLHRAMKRLQNYCDKPLIRKKLE